MSSILIKNGQIITSKNTIRSDILISDGKIAAIGKNLNKIGFDTKIVDADPFLILPGAIDPHVHMELSVSGIISSDDFETGTIAAIAGGTTTIIDFVTPSRGESLIIALKERKELAGKSLCDYSFHISLTSFNDSTYEEMKKCKEEEGITSFKTYLAYKDTIGLEDKDLFSLMEFAKKLNVLITVHCEMGDEISYLQKKFISEGKIEPKYHALSRPPEVEEEAVDKVITMAKNIGIPVYIVHVSTKNAIDKISKAQNDGQIVLAETCPHYLLLLENEYERPARESLEYIMSPPLRSQTHRFALWEGIIKGIIHTIGTDHCPFNIIEQKEIGLNDFTKIPNGVPGIENRLSLLYTFGVLTNHISINRFVDLVSVRPAKVFGLYPRKGTIQVGSDADIILWDPNKKGIISARTHHQKCDYNIYEGFQTIGSPYMVICNGNIAFEDGNLKTEKGSGRYLYRGVGKYD
jgi:dihydropyrimidinase